MKEKIILSVVAAFLGLLVAGGAFYIYQMTRTVDEPQEKIVMGAKRAPTQAPANANFIVIEKPEDEYVSDKRTVTISGKTSPGSTIIVSSETADQVVKPSDNGDFSLTQTIEDGVNLVQITAVFSNGEEKTVVKTITATTEEF
jgi:hypothetical protein